VSMEGGFHVLSNIPIRFVAIFLSTTTRIMGCTTSAFRLSANSPFVYFLSISVDIRNSGA
jgi:hypothetical protein